MNLTIIANSDILYRHWKSENPKAVFILIHGLGAHSERWNFIANFLLKQKFSSYAIELKGFGETTTLKGHIDSFNIYYQDILKICDQAKKENPGKKIFIIGESMGGLIAFNLAGGSPSLFSGLVLLSPAFKNGMRFKVIDYIGTIVSLFYNPKKQFKMPFNSEMCTTDPEYVAHMKMDKRESRLATSKLLFNILVEQVRSNILAKRISTPALFLLAGKDYLVDKKESRKIFDKLTIKDKMLIEYPEMEHALSIDLGREKVFQDILTWIEKRL